MADVMTLQARILNPQTVHHGDATVEVPAGKSLKIETSPAGLDVLHATCPAGKAWMATVSVRIVETDA